MYKPMYSKNRFEKMYLTADTFSQISHTQHTSQDKTGKHVSAE